jgi:hypothetical protein
MLPCTLLAMEEVADTVDVLLHWAQKVRGAQTQ